MNDNRQKKGLNFNGGQEIERFHDEEKIENSALSMHAKEAHGGNFNLENFHISIIKSISPQNIRREEFRYIEKYRTIQLGLNRYKAS